MAVTVSYTVTPVCFSLTLFMLLMIFLLGLSLLLLLYLMKLDLPCLMAGCSVSASAPLSSVSVVRTGPS